MNLLKEYRLGRMLARKWKDQPNRRPFVIQVEHAKAVIGSLLEYGDVTSEECQDIARAIDLMDRINQRRVDELR